MSPELEKEKSETQVLYDAAAVQRFEFEYTQSGEKYATAHVFNPLTDEKYLEAQNAIEVSGTGEDSKSNEPELMAKLWKSIINEVENIEVEDGKDFRDEIDAEDEILPSITNYLAVAVVETEKVATGRRKVGGAASEVVTTEAFFSGVPVQQTHVLKSKKDNEEFAKKYHRLERNEWKRETTKGLRRQPKMIYVPQHEAIAKLYDEMFVSQTGFANGVIPIRFKVAVISALFQSKIDPKK